MAPAALLSVSDKSNLAPFASALVAAGYQILSTGGTARHLREHDIPVTSVSDVTGFPEIMNGRVKTLHPRIHGALLGRRDSDDHLAAMSEHDIPDIQVVCVNLYPFKSVTADPEVDFDHAIENIDIGGPTMVRASAKNHAFVTIVTDPSDYDRVADTLAGGGPDAALRRELALKAFRHTADYDAAICTWLGGRVDESDAGEMPDSMQLELHATESLRYGENPHQSATLYREGDSPDYGGLEQLNGKALSYNNIVDLDAALELVREFDGPAASVIKHTNPAGCASAASLKQAFDDALACDPVSAFGGIVALNRTVDLDLAETLAETFFEIIAAPGYDEDALERLQRKKNLRVMRLPTTPISVPHVFRATSLGFLVQSNDPRISLDRAQLEVPTERAPTDEEWASLDFSWRVCKHVKSNAIVFAKGTQTIGIGAGQMSRVDAVEIAVKKARTSLEGTVLASDAFFPFRDGPDAAAAAGVTAIIQPGGSKRDQDVIDACNEHGIAMVFTGKRHFRH